MANGIKFGRRRKLSDCLRNDAIKRRDAGETLAAIAQSYRVSIAMISRLWRKITPAETGAIAETRG